MLGGHSRWQCALRLRVSADVCATSVLGAGRVWAGGATCSQGHAGSSPWGPAFWRPWVTHNIQSHEPQQMSSEKVRG